MLHEFERGGVNRGDGKLVCAQSAIVPLEIKGQVCCRHKIVRCGGHCSDMGLIRLARKLCEALVKVYIHAMDKLRHVSLAAGQ